MHESGTEPGSAGSASITWRQAYIKLSADMLKINELHGEFAGRIDTLIAEMFRHITADLDLLHRRPDGKAHPFLCARCASVCAKANMLEDI